MKAPTFLKYKVSTVQGSLMLNMERGAWSINRDKKTVKTEIKDQIIGEDHDQRPKAKDQIIGSDQKKAYDQGLVRSEISQWPVWKNQARCFLEQAKRKWDQSRRVDISLVTNDAED